MAELLNDFLEKVFEAQPMLVGRGILPRQGKLIIGGAPKANKSYIAINMALDLALGQPLFNAFYSENKPVFPVYKRNKVLYIENEIGEIGLQERVKAITGGCDMAGIWLYIKSRDMGLRMDTPDGRALITAEIEQVKPDVVILDPLSKFHLSDENSAQHMSAVMRVGDHWVEDFGTSLVYIHHTGHPNPLNPRRGGDKLRGSTAIFADADAIILVDRKSAQNAKEPVLELSFELRRGEPMDPVYVKRMRSGVVRYEGENLAMHQRQQEPELVARTPRGQYDNL